MKEFLKPEWKKFILPVILIILFFVVINVFFSMGYIMDKYQCRSIALAQDIQDYRKLNDTLFNQTANEMMALSQNMREETKHFQDKEHLIEFMKVIDPILPVSCELSSTSFCRYYTDKESYDCLNEFVLKNRENTTLFVLEYKEYSPITTMDIILNIIFLFIEGYLLSSLILFGYRKIKTKRK